MNETAIHEIRLWERPFWKPARGKGSVLFYLVLIHLLASIDPSYLSPTRGHPTRLLRSLQISHNLR